VSLFAACSITFDADQSPSRGGAAAFFCDRDLFPSIFFLFSFDVREMSTRLPFPCVLRLQINLQARIHEKVDVTDSPSDSLFFRVKTTQPVNPFFFPPVLLRTMSLSNYDKHPAFKDETFSRRSGVGIRIFSFFCDVKVSSLLVFFFVTILSLKHSRQASS